MESREFTNHQATAPLLRCLLVWAGATAALGAIVVAVAPYATHAVDLWPLERLDATPFDELLLVGSAVVTIACSAWLWLTSGLLVLEAVTGRTRSTPGCPAWFRRLVLLGCGLALATGTSPALAAVPGGHTGQVESAGQVAQPVPATAAADRAALAGLELPDRMVAGEAGLAPTQGSPRASDTTQPDTTVVRPGDSLWQIADTHAPGASDAEVDRLWREIWRLNRDVVGADPDLIHPGTRLHLPHTEEIR